MMPCPNCGQLNVANAIFCAHCGQKIVLATGRLPTNQLLASRYCVLRVIARTGFSAVYEAEDTRLSQRKVAVKEMIVPPTTGDTQAIQQAISDFQREADLLAKHPHANLPRIFDRFEEGGRHFLVMDFVEGRTLRQVLETNQRALPEAQVLDWARQLCAVLEFLHTRKPSIIYRDLKPDNIMLEEDGTIKLIDFGIARLYRAGGSSDTVPLGTPGYAAPEQYGHEQSDARSDVYGLGATLYELATGYDVSLSPFRLPPARQHNPQVSARTEHALVQALETKPEARFQQIGAFARALGAVGTSPTTTTHTVAITAPAPRVRTRRRWWIWAGLASAVLLGGWGGWRWATARNGGSSIGIPRTATPNAGPTTTVVPSVAGNVAVADTVTPVGTSTGAPTATTVPTAPTEPTNTTAPTATPPPTSSPSPTNSPEPTSTPIPTPLPTEPPPPVVAQLPAPAAPVAVASISASTNAPDGVDACGTANSYGPAKAIDGQPTTAWRVTGAGYTDWIELRFARPIAVTRLGLIVGFAKTDRCDGTDRFLQGRTVRRVRLEFDGGVTREVDWSRVREMQYVELPAIQSTRLRIVVLASDPPPAANGRDLMALSEIEVWGR